jgi:predicted nucleic acid-binding protein
MAVSRIFWDTNLFIYLFEGHGLHFDHVRRLRQSMLARSDQLITSALTLGEVLVKPIEEGDHELRQNYEEAITSTALVIPFDAPAARIFAALRTDRSLRPPDAIQLACAAHARVDLFITNGARLQSKHVDGIQFIVTLDRAPL